MTLSRPAVEPLPESATADRLVVGNDESPPVAHFRVYAWGLVAASVCTNLPLYEAIARLNRELPTGIASQWHLSSDATFADGTPNPCSCEVTATCTHFLFSC